jgi:hypothetical protein
MNLHALSESINPPNSISKDLVKGFILLGLRFVGKLLPFVIGWAVLAVLFTLSQGKELLRISNQIDHSFGHSIILALVPLSIFVSTLHATLAFAKIEISGSSSIFASSLPLPTKKRFLYIWSVAYSLVVPFALLLFFKLQLSYLLTATLMIFFSAVGYKAFSESLNETSSDSTRNRLTNNRFLSSGLALIYWICLGLALYLVATLPEIARVFGTVGVVLLAISFWATIFTHFFGIIPQRLGFPCMYPLAIVSVLIIPSAISVVSNALIPVSVSQEAKKSSRLCVEIAPDSFASARQGVNLSPSLTPSNGDAACIQQEIKSSLDPIDARDDLIRSHFLSWLSQFESYPETEPIPVYLISAEGGGIRAAIWTSSMIENFDNVTNNRFSKHAYSFSGVSGGALGIGHYLASSKNKAMSPTNATSTEGLQQDFLAPIVARMLLVEPFRLLPVLSEAFSPRDTVFESLIEQSIVPSNGTPNLLKLPLRKAFETKGNPVPPLIMLNATDALTGNRVVFDNLFGISIPENPRHIPDEYLGNLKFSSIILNSARFPVVTPPSILRVADETLALIDGGYRDNTGASSLLELLPTLENIRRSAIHPPVVQLQVLPKSPVGVPELLQEKEYLLEVLRERTHEQLNEKKRMKKFAKLLARVQFHTISLTNSFGAEVDKAGILNGGWKAEIKAPLYGVLWGRDVLSRDAISSLSATAKKHDSRPVADCRKAKSKELTRLGKAPGTADYYILADGADQKIAKCELPLRDTYQNYDLFSDKLTLDDIALGWTLALDRALLIRAEAQKNVAANTPALNKSAWWSEIFEAECSSTGLMKMSEQGEAICIESESSSSEKRSRARSVNSAR